MNKKAFTLIELLIVIAIVGILAVAFGPSLFDGPAKARDAQRIADLGKIRDFLIINYVTPGKALPNTGCIQPGGSTLWQAIQDNLADFSGVAPLGPAPYPSCIVGAYSFVNYSSSPTDKYLGMLWSKIEIAENGNYPTVPDDFALFRVGSAVLGESGTHYIVPIPKN